MQHLKVNICHRTPTVLCPSDYSVHPIQALCFVRPIEENITIIIDYMKRQTFGGYYILISHHFFSAVSKVFSHIVKETLLQRLAERDEKDAIFLVQERGVFLKEVALHV
ncbi:predicted protein [Micromonas commoda]|uniref:Uncharacterized protein n=1 Tax=Micromonas commoda (strain RCC299 / NOUM17 / CCMP2709) TaxID=296587 RepID=C1FE80_MICCC|nr:predicted protein [Micromonas commoda]ACO68919.1 predicted protein [Micromonas commoda]|eukprot:XP_002507661.1 predicted protein [Micromonas commoda]